MSGDFNQVGQEYEMLLVAPEPGHYGLLTKTGCSFYDGLQKHLAKMLADETRSPEFRRWSASLDCLRSFLYQQRRMADHANNLCALIPGPGEMLSQSAFEALADFEALLYFGRSALDRLTFAIAEQTYRQKCDKIEKLPNVLKNFTKRDVRASRAITVIDAVLDNFRGVLISHKDGRTGLRSLFAHTRSTFESMTHAFTVHRDTSNMVLRFDVELEKIGVLNAAHSLNRTVTFMALNLIAIFSEYGETVTLRDCEPSWTPNCVCLSKFIDNSEKGPRFTTMRPNAHNIEILTYHVRKELFEHAIKV